MLLLHPVTGELPFVQLNPQFRLSDVADHTEVLDSVYGFQYVVNIIRRLFRLIEVMPEDFHGNRPLDSRSSLFHIVGDRLGKIEIHPRIDREILLHLFDQPSFGQLALPLFFRIDVHMELVVEKTRCIGSIVGTTRLRHYLAHFGIGQ